MNTPEIERRAAGTPTASGRTLSGYAARFDEPTTIGSFRERIAPGAFAATLADQHDVLALLDHRADVVLGRTKSGTLRLSEDARGLRYELELPDTQAGRDAAALAARGDLGGMSFGFKAVDEHWTGDVRELRTVELFEVSVISSWPAYSGTSIDLRNRPAAPESRPLYLWLETCR